MTGSTVPRLRFIGGPRKVLVIAVLIVLVVIGVVLYLIENYIPMSPPIKLLIRVVVVLFVVLWLLRLVVGPIRIPLG